MTGQVRRGTLEDVRRHNLATLIGHLHVSGPMRRADLTTITGLNRSTVAALVAELAGLGLVRELAEAAAARPRGRAAGRPSATVQVRTDAVQVLAADVGVGRVEVALVGLGGNLLARRARTLRGSTPGQVARVLVAAARSLLADPVVAPRVLGLGVSVPGVIRGRDGNVRFAPNLGWTDVAFGNLLGARLPGLPVRLANDGDLGVVAEHRRGVARGIDDVVFILGETGVGAGAILGGLPLVGAGGYGGELGHMTIHPEGLRCRCGAQGCWETEIGGVAVGRALGLTAPGDPGLVAALAELTPADPRVHALDGVADYLGLGLANVVNLLNPRLIVLGGLFSLLYPLLADRVRTAMAAAALAAPAEQVRIVLPELGHDALLLGAAELAWEGLLADPVGALRDSPDRTLVR